MNQPDENTSDLPFDRAGGELLIPSSDGPVETAVPRLQATLETADLLAASGNHAQALENYLRLWALPAYHGDLGLARRIAFCQEQSGRYREAIQILTPLLAEIADDILASPAERLEQARSRLILGKSCLEAGLMDEAEAEGLRVSSLVKDLQAAEVGIALNLLGTVSFRRGDLDQAKIRWRSALEHFRSRGDVRNLALSYMNLGNTYKQRCEWTKTIEHYQAAYYLRATEGDPKDQGGILRNLSLVLMRVGRYEEAREKLEESLRRAHDQADPIRGLRSHLALAKLARESMLIAEAKEQLQACLESAPDPFPEREGCLLMIEQALMAKLEGRLGEARDLARRLRLHVERLASHGDLMIDTLILEGRIELASHEFAEAEDRIQRALAMARERNNRDLENDVLLVQVVLLGRAGRTAEERRVFELLEDRYQHWGEQPSLARLYESRGWLERWARGDAEAALVWFTKARDLWRRMSCHRVEATIELRIAEVLCELSHHAEAAALLRSVRERSDEEFLSLAPSATLLREAEDRLGAGEATAGVRGLDGEQALARVDDILAGSVSPGEQVRSLLVALTEALGAEGALLGRISSANAGARILDVACSVSMGRLQGRRQIPLVQLGVETVDHGIMVGRNSSSGGSSTPAGMLLPVLLFGQDHLVYLERRDPATPPYVRSDLDYAMVLLAHAVRGLRPLADPSVEAEVAEVGRKIWLADVVTQNVRMHSILELIRKVGDSDLTVLLQGETGTGKKLLAQAIHRTSGRRSRPLVTVDCAALPDTLLESELFGHRKGAFTGAIADRIGLLEEANGGTIFLDEIDKAGLQVQRRFLHLLDSGEVRPVGSSGYRRLDVRVVCATSCPDLRLEVQEGRFLKDLYYRLNDISIVVPPLRERPDDVPLLAEWFLNRFSQETGREISGVSASFHTALAAHSWPGNIRELEKAIRRVVILADNGAVIGPDLLPSAVQESGLLAESATGGSLHEKVERYERSLVLEALDRTEWNRSRAAVDLGLSRKGLKNKIQRYKLDRRRTRRV